MSDLIVNEKCIGCTLCKNICPKNAVSLEPDKHGFYVAKINENMCINCGLCHKKCIMASPVSNNDLLKAKCFYAFSTNREERIASTSGGVFFLLAKSVLEKGGYVCGCVWDENFVAKHIVTNSYEDLKLMRGSKYVQSNMGDCFSTIRNILEKNITVLFSGTGCQVNALDEFLDSKLKANLITCSVVCGGVPSPAVWSHYVKALESKANSRITSVNLRAKKHGWLVPELEIGFKSGKRINQNLLQENYYGTNFGLGLFINQCCMNCRFKLYNLKSDIVLSDHWGIDYNHLERSENLGSSAIITLTEKGIGAFEKINHLLCFESGKITDIIDSHKVLTKDHDPNIDRERFFEDFNNDRNDVLAVLKKYYKKWEKKAGRGFAFKVLYRTGLYNKLYLRRWKKRNKNRVTNETIG